MTFGLIAVILAFLIGGMAGWFVCALVSMRRFVEEYEAGRDAGRREQLRRDAYARSGGDR